LNRRASLYGQFDVARMPVTGQTMTVMVPRSLEFDERRDEFEFPPWSIWFSHVFMSGVGLGVVFGAGACSGSGSGDKPPSS
jgi:hypothetical protein